MDHSFKRIEGIADELRYKDLNLRLSSELLGRMYIEDRILNTTELNIVKRELENPTYDVFAEDTAWNLYNHCTHALKTEHASTSIKKHIEVTEFFEKEFC